MRFLLLSLFFLSFCFNSFSLDWKKVNGEHFIVHYMQDDQFARDLLYKAESYYKNIASELGYPRYSEFWTWDNRVKIYVYPTQAEFQASTGQPQWSQGMADYTNKQIVSYAWSKGFLEALLPHEIAHLIFRDFVGFKGEVPLWLDEGVAQWSEQEKRKKVKSVAARLFNENMFLYLGDMMRMDSRNLNEGTPMRPVPAESENPEDASYLSGDSLVRTYYIQSASLVGFLIERYGSESFAYFCRQLRDGKTINEALSFAYPNRVPDLDTLETEWRKYLLE